MRPIGGGDAPADSKEIRLGVDWLGGRLECLVDTGATTSLVSTEWWKRNGRPGELRQVATPRVTMADGTELKVLGRCGGEMKVEGRVYWARFIVAEIDEEAILGMDFLVEHRVLIDAATKKLRFEAPDAQRILLARALVVAGGEEVDVDAVLETDFGMEQGIVEGLREVEDRYGVRVCRSLVTPEDGYVPIRILNPGPEAVTLYENTTMAKVGRGGRGGRGRPRAGPWRREVPQSGYPGRAPDCGGIGGQGRRVR